MSEPSYVDREAEVERVDLGEGAWVDVVRGWFADPDEVFEALDTGVPWQTSRLFRYDHHVEERRLGSFWRTGSPLPHPALGEATRVLQHQYRVRFDGFGMIQYRDGRDGQGFHRDKDMRWLEDTIIAVLSLGARRPWLLRPARGRHTGGGGDGAGAGGPGSPQGRVPGGEVLDLSPASGDLLVMGGRAQTDWEHSVPYLGDVLVGPRISIQWRHARRVGRPYQGPSYRAPRTYGRG